MRDILFRAKRKDNGAKAKATPEAAIIELNRCKVNGYMPVDWDGGESE